MDISISKTGSDDRLWDDCRLEHEPDVQQSASIWLLSGALIVYIKSSESDVYQPYQIELSL